MQDDIKDIYEFSKKAREFYKTYRFTPNPDGGFENDAEHSWSVALLCTLLTSRLEEEFGTHLDQARMLKMALIHDLAEIETGDTKPWDALSRVGKEDKERTAIHSLAALLPADVRQEIISLWEECERKETFEAKIVKSIDRMDPVLHRTVFDIGWKAKIEGEHATREALDARQLPRHEFSRTLTALYETIRDEAVAKDMFDI